MKVSCLPVSLFSDIVSGTMTIGDWAREGKKAGLDAVDFSNMFLREHTPVYYRTIRQMLEQEGMSVTMMTTYPDFTHPDKQQRERELEYLAFDFAQAAQLGIKYIRVLAGQAHPGVKREDGIRWAVEYLKRACGIAEKYGVVPVYEDHAKPGAWDYIDFSHPADIFTEIYEKTEDVGLRVNFDTANIIAYGADTMEVLQKVLPRLETIHAADTSTRGTLNHCEIGKGLAPFKEIFSLIKKNGFDGWICIEEGSMQGMYGIEKAVRYVRKVWGEVK